MEPPRTPLRERQTGAAPPASTASQPRTPKPATSPRTPVTQRGTHTPLTPPTRRQPLGPSTPRSTPARARSFTPDLQSPGLTPVDRSDSRLGAPFPHWAQTTPQSYARSARASRSFEVVTWNTRGGRASPTLRERLAAARKSPMPLRTPPRRSIDDECCSICLEPLTDDKQRIHVLQTCSHRFHLDCIKRARERMATPCCPLCRGDLGAGLTPQQSRSRTPALDRFRFSAHRGYAVAEHTSAIRSNASRVRARMMAAPLRPLGEDDGLLGGEPQRFTLTDEDPVF